MSAAGSQTYTKLICPSYDQEPGDYCWLILLVTGCALAVAVIGVLAMVRA